MRCGWIGLGKLGLPVALTMSDAGHAVIGTDLNPDVKGYLDSKTIPYQEQGVPELWAKGAQVGWRDTIGQVVYDSDIVFIAVQTPHASTHEGVTPTPSTPKDFEYGYLEEAVKAVVKSAQHPVTVVVVSTVLPGTMRRVVMPHMRRNPMVRFAYSPAFIAMGTTAYDWTHPAMVIVGSDSQEAYNDVVAVHRTQHTAPVLRIGIESAELTKVLYNTFISMKIMFANTAMELAHKTGADCDEIAFALGHATDRILSPKYLRGGMGDGGGCHPRDNHALSWLADRVQLSANPFNWLMRSRDAQTKWIGQLALEWARLTDLSIVICGREFKKNTNITTGSPSVLLYNLIKNEWHEVAFLEDFFDKNESSPKPWIPAIYVIGVNHDRYKAIQWPKESVVIDPHGYIEDQDGVVVVRVGRK